MKSTYLIIGIISLIVLGAIIFGFSSAGSPFETRARKFDDERIKDIRNLSSSIQGYYTKNSVLPKTLSELDNSSYYLSPNSKKDPETGEEYEYSVTNSTNYDICATFATDSDKDKDPYSYYSKEFNHPKGYHCFNLEIQNYSRKSASTSTTSTQKTITFQDEKIESVISNASKLQSFTTVNFPFGFFSSNSDEWGLINYADKSVTVTIKFKAPVKISSLSNTFTNCSGANCYTWTAVGTTKNKKAVVLIKETVANNNIASKQKIDSTEEFDVIELTATRNSGDGYVHWKKITFEYK